MNRTNITIHLTPPLPRRPPPSATAAPSPGGGGAGFVRRAFSLDSLGHVAPAPVRRLQASSGVSNGAGHPTRRSFMSVPVGVAAPHTQPPLVRSEVRLQAQPSTRPCVLEFNLDAAPHPSEAHGRPPQWPRQQEAARGSKTTSGPKKYFSGILHAFGAAAPRLRGVLNNPGGSTCAAAAVPPGEGASPWVKSGEVQVGPSGASSHKYLASSDVPRPAAAAAAAAAAARRNSCDSALTPSAPPTPTPTPTPPTRRRRVRAFASRAFINIGGGEAGSTTPNTRYGASPRSFSYENLDFQQQQQQHVLNHEAPPLMPLKAPTLLDAASAQDNNTLMTRGNDTPTMTTPTTCETLPATAKVAPIKAATPMHYRTPTPAPTPMHSPLRVVPPTPTAVSKVTPLTTAPSTFPPTAPPASSGIRTPTSPPSASATVTVTPTWAPPSPTVASTPTLLKTVPPIVRARPRSRSQDSRHSGTHDPRPRARSVCALGQSSEEGTREDQWRGCGGPGCQRRPRPPSLPPTPPSRLRRVSPGPSPTAGSQPPLVELPWWRSWVEEEPFSLTPSRESLSTESESMSCSAPAVTLTPASPQQDGGQQGRGSSSGCCPIRPATPPMEVEVNLSEGEVRVVTGRGGAGCPAAPHTDTDTDTDTDSAGGGEGGEGLGRVSPESCGSTSTSGGSGRASPASCSPSLVHAAPCWVTNDSDAASTDSCCTHPHRSAPPTPCWATSCCLHHPFLPEEVTSLYVEAPCRATARTHPGTPSPLLDPAFSQDPACSAPALGQLNPAPPHPTSHHPPWQDNELCPAPAPSREDPTPAPTQAWENSNHTAAREGPSQAATPQWEEAAHVPASTKKCSGPTNGPSCEYPSSSPAWVQPSTCPGQCWGQARPQPAPAWPVPNPCPVGEHQHLSASRTWEQLPEACEAEAGVETEWARHHHHHHHHLQRYGAMLPSRPPDALTPTPTHTQAPPRPGETEKPPRSPRRSRDSTSVPREVPRPAPPRPRSLSASCRYRVQLDIPPRPASFTSLTPPRPALRPLEPLDETLGAPQGVSEPRRLAERKKNEGNDLYKSKQYREALSLYTQAIELCPDCAAYYSNRSACYMMMGKYTDALSDAREAVRLDKAFVKGYIRVAKCNIALGDATAALSVLREAGELEPGSKAVKEEEARAHTLTRCLDETDKACGKGDFRTAIFHLDRALELAQGCKGLKIRKAEHLVALQRYADAQEMVNEILQFDSTNADAIYVRGMCLYYQDNPEAAFNHFQHVLRLAPDHQKAREVYKKAKQLTQKKEEGNEAFRKGRHQEALALYTEALALDPVNTLTNAKLYFNRAVVNAKLNRLEQAIEDCTAAVNLDEGYLKAYLRRAKCYQQLEQHEEAIRDYEKVVRLDKSQEHKRLLQEAKVQLKRSKRKDYYRILGVSKNASDDEIKKSYKKMALVHHPDRHSSSSEKDKQEHEIKFKEIGEAYAVLTDAKKRALYDRGHDLNDPDSGFSHEDIDPSQIFQAFFGGGHGGYAFNHAGGFQQQHQGGYPGGFGGSFPGGFHFQFG